MRISMAKLYSGWFENFLQFTSFFVVGIPRAVESVLLTINLTIHLQWFVQSNFLICYIFIFILIVFHFHRNLRWFIYHIAIVIDLSGKPRVGLHLIWGRLILMRSFSGKTYWFGWYSFEGFLLFLFIWLAFLMMVRFVSYDFFGGPEDLIGKI